MLEIGARRFCGPALAASLAACTSGPSAGTSVGDHLSNASRLNADGSGDAVAVNKVDATGAIEASDVAADELVDASQVLDAGPLTLPDSGWCSTSLGPVPASEVDASHAFACPGLCVTGLRLVSLPPPPPPGGSDGGALPAAYYVCQVGNGTVINFGGD